MTEKTIYALATCHTPYLENTIWAFDILEEYQKALMLILTHKVPFVRFHDAYREPPAPISNVDKTDQEWCDLSEGINDAKELENALKEWGAIK